jgi:hypothetical protein
MKKAILMKGSRQKCTGHGAVDLPMPAGRLSDVFVCMRAAEGGLRIHTNTEQ